jgi:E3 ubiquitin-protein ligase synoviolin
MADDRMAENVENEEVIRRQRQEEEMERLLLAQENQDNNDNEPPPQQDDQEEVDLQQALQQDMLGAPQQQQHYKKRLPYTQTSFLAAILLVYYALRTRQQWYLALVYLTSSKWAYIVLGNALIALCVSTFRFFTRTFLQGLRLAEAEGLGDFFRWNVTETCLALTMFRSELDVNTFLVFLLLVLGKCLHWVAETREGHLRMTQEAIVPIESGYLQGFPKIPSTHIGLFLLLNCLMIMDIAAVAQCALDIYENGPSVAILFGFETAILLVTALSSTILWNLHVIDGILHYLHDHTSNTRWIHTFLHIWKDHKATLIFAVEVQAQGATFLFYVTFFAIVLTYYGLPINLFREVYLSFQKLRQRLLAFANYRRLMASMDRFESVASEEELEEAGRVCIICRDEMTLQGSKRLPGCGHVFHKSCLREWLVQQQSCPTCRGDIAAMEARQRQQQRLERAAQEQQERQQEQEREQAAAAPPEAGAATAAAAPAAAAAPTATAPPTSSLPAPAQQPRGVPELKPELTITPGAAPLLLPVLHPPKRVFAFRFLLLPSFQAFTVSHWKVALSCGAKREWSFVPCPAVWRFFAPSYSG